MSKEKILAVDDEEDICELIRFNLEKNGYKVFIAESGEKALEKALSILPDLIILDLMLPGIDGLEVAKKLKADAATQSIPIIMLTAKGEEADIVIGLEIGADDYIVKPFSPRVLAARIKAVLRGRTKTEIRVDETIQIHNLVIDQGRRQVTVDGRIIELTFTEFQLLLHLANRPGWVSTRYQIVDAVRGVGYAVTERSVDVQIAGLRKKLDKYGTYIETVRGVGYRFKETP